MTDSGTVQIFNKADFMERVMEDEDLAKMITEAYLEDIPNQIINLKDALETTDIPLIERQAHTIKGATSNVGGEVVQGVALKVEIASRNSDLEEVRRLLPELEKNFESLKATLLEFINNPNG